MLCKMQSVSSRIWTCVAVSISYDDNITPQAPARTYIYQLCADTGAVRRRAILMRKIDWLIDI